VGKISKNLYKIPENVSKLPENTSKNGTQNHMRSLFLEVTFFWSFFRQVWGNSGKNPSQPQKFACSYSTPMPMVPCWCGVRWTIWDCCWPQPRGFRTLQGLLSPRPSTENSGYENEWHNGVVSLITSNFIIMTELRGTRSWKAKVQEYVATVCRNNIINPMMWVAL